MNKLCLYIESLKTFRHVMIFTETVPPYTDVAEGVRLYSQETWRVVTENRGVELVGQYISQVSEGTVCSVGE